MSAQDWADLGIEVPYGRTGEIDVVCPKCSPTRRKSRERCLSINTETKTYFCHHCQWSGGLDGVGARPGRPIGLPPPPRVYQRPDPVPETALPEAVVAWFAGRGIPAWVLAENRIGAGRRFVPQLDREALTVQFPYFRDGELVNVKYRAHPKHFFMARGAERILYGLDGIAGAPEIVVVEGEMDKLTVDAVQGPPCVSVPDGAPAPDAANYGSKFAFLDGAHEHFAAAKTVLIATDTDAPGQKLADELARRFGYHKCKRVVWPEGCKDANETLAARGERAVLEALADAQPYPVAGIVTVRDLAGPLEALYERGFDRGCAVGWPTFDRHYRARHGLLTIVTGSPGSGKSVFLDNLMVRLAVQHGWSFAVCSPENQPLERHLAGILAVYRGQPFTDGPTPRMTLEEMREAQAWAERHFAFVLPEEPSLDQILERARTLVYRMGVRGLVVDPWNELDHSRPERMTETEFVSQALTKLRNFARENGVAVWLVAHPTKLQKNADGTYPVPSPYDISGSANFNNKADACFAVWRDRLNPAEPTQLHIQKIRFAETGEVGKVHFSYEPATGRFRDVGV